MLIKRYKNKDYEALLHLLKDTDADFLPPLSERKDLKEYLDADIKLGEILISSEGPEITGMISFAESYDRYGGPSILTFAVAKPYRGKGHGKRLLERCIEDLKKRGVDRVIARTWSTNEAVLNLYHKTGFHETKIVKDGRGPGIHTVFLEKMIH